MCAEGHVLVNKPWATMNILMSCCWELQPPVGALMFQDISEKNLMVALQETPARQTDWYVIHQIIQLWISSCAWSVSILSNSLFTELFDLIRAAVQNEFNHCWCNTNTSCFLLNTKKTYLHVVALTTLQWTTAGGVEDCSLITGETEAGFWIRADHCTRSIHLTWGLKEFKHSQITDSFNNCEHKHHRNIQIVTFCRIPKVSLEL